MSVNKRYAFKPSMAIVFVPRPHTLHSWCPSPVNGLDVCEVLRRAILGEGRGRRGEERKGQPMVDQHPIHRRQLYSQYPFVWSCVVTKLTLYLPEVINI